MPATVYFTDLRSRANNSLLDKTGRLFDRALPGGMIRKGDNIAVKLHWGEAGNTAFLPPPYVRRIVKKIIEAGGNPFLTDTNTLYSGARRNAVDNITTALKNGFSLLSTGAPVIIADGLKGDDAVEVKLEGAVVSSVKVAGAIYHADAMVVLSHFKGHELYGFGGALKNVAMGCTTPAGKQILHSDIKPRVKTGTCTGCGACIAICPVNAIRRDKKGKALINESLCIGCAECTATCPVGAIPVNWKTAHLPLFEKSAAFIKAILENKKDRCVFINFLINISPECDCYGWNDAAFVADIGIAASTDPVALDQASADLVNTGQVLASSKLEGRDDIADKIAAATCVKEWALLLELAEKAGVGTREYEMMPVK